MSTEPHHNHKTLIQISLGLLALILVVVAMMFLTRSYPIAMVGSNFISNREFEDRVALAKKLEANPDKDKVFDQMIIDAKKEQMVGRVDLDEELKYYQTGRVDEYNKFVNDYFSGDEKKFSSYVVLPRAQDAILAQKYNHDYGINKDAYDKANNVITRLNNGEEFEDLAKIFSDDKITGQLGGDLGFVSEGQLLPELEKAVKAATLGEVKKQIAVSRLGYHIIYPVETAQKDGQIVWHVKHILITTSGYDGWLQKQLDTIKVRHLFN